MNWTFYEYIKYISAAYNLLKLGNFLRFEVFTSNMEKWPIRPFPKICHSIFLLFYLLPQFYRNNEISETDYVQSVTYCIQIKEMQIS